VRFDETFQAFAENIGVPVVVADVDGVVVLANGPAREMFCGLLQLTVEQFLGGTAWGEGWSILGEDGNELEPTEHPGHRARYNGEVVCDQVLGLAPSDAPPLWVMQSSIPLPSTDHPGRNDVVSTFVDITLRRELEATLEQRASHDPLTGLANRVLFEDRLLQAAKRADRNDHPVTLMMLDLDDFKICNDLYGHAVGDALLVAAAERLRALVRSSDTVARLGGDEFALLLEGADVDRADELARAILEALRVPIVVDDDREVSITASIGIAVWDADDALGEIQVAADDAVFAAKHAGKDSYHRHDQLVGRASGVVVTTRAEDAHAWTGYVRGLRIEIDERKRQGRLPTTVTAPASVFRVLRDILGRIDRLPPVGDVLLELPRERDVSPFVFHHITVGHWVDQLRNDGVLTARPSPGADRFWMDVQRALDFDDR
jgi:diguanylate cyclase (GGDEF)-like protein